MPLECPIALPGSCTGCMNLSEDNCCYCFFPRRPISEFLTDNERIEMLEAKREVSAPWTQRQQDQLRQLQGHINFVENKVNKIFERRNRYARY